MGIKGIYKEIGGGTRISLTKLAVQKLEEAGRPLRIAIDISIWQFQVQAARGKAQPMSTIHSPLCTQTVQA
ncbi:putative flap structure-specific endonuclease [Rosellinia necatrix]|uniref:Putative flap structure-specific endonuclease n=1 Tax=Rosellinia necatrix TaxID=77044 RepID=A0A1S8A5C5_ROSNE|nr:putative flap structure-specific endonuclease [Rosellinia necatrix]